MSKISSRARVLSGIALIAAMSNVCAKDPGNAAKKPPKTSAEIIAASPATDWRDVAPIDLLVMDVPQGQVLIELAKRFAPAHAANIRTLAHEAYYDGLAIIRVQDNYVTQWGDPNGDDVKLAKPLGTAAPKVPAEFSVAYRGLPISKLKDNDGWASVTGFVDGFPVAAEPKQNKAWLTHCYGMVGAGRGEAVDSSTGAELYAIIGHAPRGLDLNITVVGRVPSIVATLGMMSVLHGVTERILQGEWVKDLPPGLRASALAHSFEREPLGSPAVAPNVRTQSLGASGFSLPKSVATAFD